MKHRFAYTIIYIGACLLLPWLSSCNQQEDIPETTTAMTLDLGSITKPTYPEEINLMGGSRAVDSASEIDNNWKNGDVIGLTLTISDIFNESITLTHNGTTFVSSDNTKLSVVDGKLKLTLPLTTVTTIKTVTPGTYSLAISATYTPVNLSTNTNPTFTNYNQSITLNENAELTSKFIISFSHQTARLRVHTRMSGQTVTFNNGTEYSETTNANGNAFYYGPALNNATTGLTIKVGSKTIYQASAYNPVTLTAGNAYAIDASDY